MQLQYKQHHVNVCGHHLGIYGVDKMYHQVTGMKFYEDTSEL